MGFFFLKLEFVVIHMLPFLSLGICLKTMLDSAQTFWISCLSSLGSVVNKLFVKEAVSFIFHHCWCYWQKNHMQVDYVYACCYMYLLYSCTLKRSFKKNLQKCDWQILTKHQWSNYFTGIIRRLKYAVDVLKYKLEVTLTWNYHK